MLNSESSPFVLCLRFMFSQGPSPCKLLGPFVSCPVMGDAHRPRTLDGRLVEYWQWRQTNRTCVSEKFFLTSFTLNVIVNDLWDTTMLNIDPPYPRYKGLTLLTIGYTSKLWQGFNNYIRTSPPRPPPSWGQESSRCREVAVMVG